MLNKQLCARGGAHIFAFNNKYAEIEKGCRLPPEPLQAPLWKADISKPVVAP